MAAFVNFHKFQELVTLVEAIKMLTTLTVHDWACFSTEDNRAGREGRREGGREGGKDDGKGNGRGTTDETNFPSARTIIVNNDHHRLWYCPLACSCPIHELKVHIETLVILLNIIIYDLNSNATS